MLADLLNAEDPEHPTGTATIGSRFGYQRRRDVGALQVEMAIIAHAIDQQTSAPTCHWPKHSADAASGHRSCNW